MASESKGSCYGEFVGLLEKKMIIRPNLRGSIHGQEGSRTQ